MGTLLILFSMFGLIFTSMFNDKGLEHMMEHKINNKKIIFFFILFSFIVLFIGINLIRYFSGCTYYEQLIK